MGDRKKCLTVWNWKSGQVLFVCQSFLQSINRARACAQELEVEHGDYCAEFIDNYRLLLVNHSANVVGLSPLLLIDSGKFVGTSPAQTVLHFCPWESINYGFPSILLERGAYKPSLAESQAPFHPDPSQRIVVLRFSNSSICLVIRVEALLEFLRSHEGSEIAWGEWRSYVVVPSTKLDVRKTTHIWVSGCRMFSLHPADSGQGAQIEVHDFSARGRAKYSSRKVNENLPEVRYLSSTGAMVQVQLGHILGVYGGHGCIVFLEVSVPVQFCSP